MEFDFQEIFSNMYAPLFDFVGNIINFCLTISIITLLIFVFIFFLTCKINPFKLTPEYLENLNIHFLPYNLVRFVLWDILTAKDRRKKFSPYGFTIFCGRQGSGKTVSMVQYLNDMKKKYPNCIIVTNFSYINADHRMNDWKDFLEIRNGEDVVIFAIDEIHSEYSSSSWKDFPECLLSEISKQRKQKIKIVATAQV